MTGLGDEIAELHRANAKRGLYSKSAYMTWRACRRKAGVDLVGNGPVREGRSPWLWSGSLMHEFADFLQKEASKEEIMRRLRGCVTGRQVKGVLWECSGGKFLPKFLHKGAKKVVEREMERWRECMKADVEEPWRYWVTPFREMYVESGRMALNIDRLEWIPGKPGELRLMEFKKKVKDNIRQELAWYYRGLEEWCEEQHRCEDARVVMVKGDGAPKETLHWTCGENCGEVGVKITEWGALGYDKVETSFVSKISKSSLRVFDRDVLLFLRDMDEVREGTIGPWELQGLVPENKTQRLSILCSFCDYQVVCWKELNYRD